MECPKCGSQQVQRNGYRNQVQCYRCKRCGRQFLASYKQMRYTEEVKQHCLRLYFKGLSSHHVERLTGVHHTTILSWIQEVDALKFLNDVDLDSMERSTVEEID